MIEYGAESDARRGCDALVAALQRHGAALARPSVEAAAASATTPDAAADGVAEKSVVDRRDLMTSRMQELPNVYSAGIIVALVLLAACICWTGVIVCQELRNLTDAVANGSACPK